MRDTIRFAIVMQTRIAANTSRLTVHVAPNSSDISVTLFDSRSKNPSPVPKSAASFGSRMARGAPGSARPMNTTAMASTPASATT